MFGHQDDVNHDNQIPVSGAVGTGPAWSQDPTTPSQTTDTSVPSAPPVPTSSQPDNSSHATVSNDHTGEYLLEPPENQQSPSSSNDDNSTPTDTVKPAGDDDLLNIKQQALQQLTPLVGHLEQSPEEKFRTTMMMIQASDNKALLQEAYEAALSITDEKVRAQALLDVVNEINYFTQQHEEAD